MAFVVSLPLQVLYHQPLFNLSRVVNQARETLTNAFKAPPHPKALKLNCPLDYFLAQKGHYNLAQFLERVYGLKVNRAVLQACKQRANLFTLYQLSKD